jgi:hypothetical protein
LLESSPRARAEPVEAFVPLEPVARLPPDLRTRIVLHGGSESWSLKQGRALSYRQIDRVDWVGRG